MVIIARSRNDNGCWTIRGGVALDLLLGESFSPILGRRLLNSRAAFAFRSRRRDFTAGPILPGLSERINAVTAQSSSASGSVLSPIQSGGGPPHSRTLREETELWVKSLRGRKAEIGKQKAEMPGAGDGMVGNILLPSFSCQYLCLENGGGRKSRNEKAES